MRRTTKLILTVAVLLAATSTALAVPVPLESDPNNAWTVSVVAPAGQGNSTVFAPVPADYVGATPLGYYSDANMAIGTVFGSGGEDTIRLFKTFVYADSPTTVHLPIYVGGDDGHSVTLNGATILTHVLGGPFSEITLDLHPGINELEAAVYNGPGASLIQLTTNPSLGQISAVPGLFMNADGNFPNVPEPSTIILAVTCVLGCIAFKSRLAS